MNNHVKYKSSSLFKVRYLIDNCFKSTNPSRIGNHFSRLLFLTYQKFSEGSSKRSIARLCWLNPKMSEDDGRNFPALLGGVRRAGLNVKSGVWGVNFVGGACWSVMTVVPGGGVAFAEVTLLTWRSGLPGLASVEILVNGKSVGCSVVSWSMF